jgi:hypothetical protein
LPYKERLAILGSAVLAALESSKEGIPPPAKEEVVFSPVLSAFGFKTWGYFVKDALALSVRYNGTRVYVTPTEKSGVSFLHRDADKVECPSEPEAVGRAILDAFGVLHQA